MAKYKFQEGGPTRSSFSMMNNCNIKVCGVFYKTLLYYYFLCLTIYIFHVILIMLEFLRVSHYVLLVSKLDFYIFYVINYVMDVL
jgi:hypothetical protein